MTLDECIQQVLALDEKATKGPWQQCDFLPRAIHEVGKCFGPYLVGPVGEPINSEVIVHYRTSAPLLAKACQMMKEILETARDTIANNPKGSYRGTEAGSINAHAYHVLAQGLADVEKMFDEDGK